VWNYCNYIHIQLLLLACICMYLQVSTIVEMHAITVNYIHLCWM
jgi:hypothetical protein